MNNDGSRDAGIVYNVTIKVTNAISESWLEWLLKEHIPDVLATGCFVGSRVVRLLEIDDSEGPTYAVQYEAVSKADYNRYIELYADEKREQSFARWGDQFMAFRSVMQIVSG